MRDAKKIRDAIDAAAVDLYLGRLEGLFEPDEFERVKREVIGTVRLSREKKDATP